MPKNAKMGIPEKPKDFKNSIKKLFDSLKKFKVLIILSLVLAALGSILSLMAPNRLTLITDEIQKGISINTKNIEILEKDLTSKMNKEMFSKILGLSLDYNTIVKVNSSNITNEDKMAFNNICNSLKEKPDEALSLIGNIPESVLNIILTDSNIDNIDVTVSDKITFINLLKDFDINSKDYSFIKNMPENINKVLFPNTNIDGVEVTTNEKIAFVTLMSSIGKDAEIKEVYTLIDKLPNSIQKIMSPNMNIKRIITITITLSIFYLLSASFTYIQGISMVNVSNKYAKMMRSKIASKINRLPLKYFDGHATGDILSRVTNDVDTIAQSLDMSLSNLVSSLTLFIGSIVMMFYTNYIMAITAIVSSIIGFIFMFIILGKSQKYFTARQTELGKLNGHIEEVYSGLTVIKAYNGKKEVDKTFDKLNQRVYECNQKSQFLSGMMQPIMGFIGNFGYVMVCVIGALLVSNDVITFGVIVAFIVYVRLFTSPLSQIAQAMTSLQTTAAASERVFEFLDEGEMTNEKEITKKIDKKNTNGRIEFQNVKFGYDKDKIIIKDFTAVAKPGQKIAIVGPTGAGKTTMVNLLMKFYEINSGDIKIDGISTKELSRNNIHKLFTMVLQDTWIFNGTVKENIVYNRKNINDKRIKEVCSVVGVDHFIKTLPNGYDSVLSDSESISAGQKQLITIARAMLEDTPFLILDEATSNVDTRTEELVQKAMDKLMEGRTSFIIAHRLSTIKNADLILVMKDGNIIETGNHNTLMKKNGFYAELYNSQFENIG